MSQECQFDRDHPHGHVTRCGWKAEITRKYTTRGVLGEEQWYLAIVHLPTGHLADIAVTLDGRHVNNHSDLDLINYHPSETLS